MEINTPKRGIKQQVLKEISSIEDLRVEVLECGDVIDLTLAEVRKEVEDLIKARVWNGNDGLKELLNKIGGKDD